MLGIELHSAFCKNHRPLRRGNLAQRAANHFLRMPDPVHRRRIDPIHAVIDRAPYRRDGNRIVLRAPRINPPRAARRPCAKPTTVISMPLDPSGRFFNFVVFAIPALTFPSLDRLI